MNPMTFEIYENTSEVFESFTTSSDLVIRDDFNRLGLTDTYWFVENVMIFPPSTNNNYL